MKLKKCFTVLLSVILLTSSISLHADAKQTSTIVIDEVAPAYEYANQAFSELSVSSDTALCSSSCTGNISVVKVTVEQTLQKRGGLFWLWNDVAGAIWSKTNNSRSITISKSKSGLESGTYRLKSVFTLTSSSGDTETITVYSETCDVA